MDQKLIIERVRIDLVGSSWCFTDVSFIMAVYGENVFLAAEEKIYILLLIHTQVSSTVAYIMWKYAV